MNLFRQYCVLILFIAFFIEGCKSPNDTETFETGDRTVVVSVTLYDEFYRSIPAEGSSNVILFLKDRSINQVIPDGDSITTFSNVPLQVYNVSVGKSGYFTRTHSRALDTTNKIIQMSFNLHPIPSSTTRIDSIHSLLNTVTPQVRFQLFAAQSVPSNGIRSVVLFAGITPDVSSTFRTYVFVTDWISQPRGSSEIDTKDFYKELHASGIPSGTRVYVTARITTGATTISTDSITGLMVYTNLENNTNAVASFILP